MRANPRYRGDEGSIALTVMVSTITIALSAALLTTVMRDIRVSRKNGDSANALQIADAGVNDAIKSLRNAVGVVGACPKFPTLPGFTRSSTIAGGTYTYCAAADTDSIGRPVWHVDATGTDATGVKRRIRSDAISVPVFPNAINVMAGASFSSGFSIDSFKDEVNRCTRKGKIATNDPANFSFGNNGNNSSENCQNNPNGAYTHPPDGCVALSRDGTAQIPDSTTGSGRCPLKSAGLTTAESPEFTPYGAGPPQVYDLPTTSGPGANFNCTNATLQAGKVYYYTAVTLGEGCGFPAAGPFPTMANPTKIYTTTLTIAGGQGNSGLNPINQPPNSATVCGPTHGVSGSDAMYCPGWSGGLQIFVVGSGQVTWSGNHSTFWGVINAPSSSVTWSGGGGSQWEIFGSMVAQSVTGGTQAKWHYDENLGAVTSGRFYGKNWREEPLN